MDDLINQTPDEKKTNGTNANSTEKPQKYQPNALMKIKTYLTALRPWSLSGQYSECDWRSRDVFMCCRATSNDYNFQFPENSLAKKSLQS